MKRAGRAPIPRGQQFLDTVALGSMLVFASVMPPLPRQEGAVREEAAPVRDAQECPEHESGRAA